MLKRTGRGEGVGRKLITTLLEKLTEKEGLEKIKLEVVLTQIPAITMYKSLGFQETGITKDVIGWVTPFLDELNMELTL